MSDIQKIKEKLEKIIRKRLDNMPNWEEYMVTSTMTVLAVNDLYDFFSAQLSEIEEKLTELEHPQEDIACDYGDHIDKDQVLSILTSMKQSK